MSKRRIRRKRRARVKILPLILVGAVIVGVITVIMSVNLKGADKEPPTEEIYITKLYKLRKLRTQSRRQSWSTILIIHIRIIR